MKNRKILYGYRTEHGRLTLCSEEADTVRRIFTLYIAGASYQNISDTMNREQIPFSAESPLWNKHKVKRVLENPRYTGRDGYPAIIAEDIFLAVQDQIQNKTANYSAHNTSATASLRKHLRCAACDGRLLGLGGKRQNKQTLYLKCECCGAKVTVPETALLDEISQQWVAHQMLEPLPYEPSSEVIRLTNAINRSLEQPNSPEDVIALILQGAAARYDCCPISMPIETDLKDFRQAVSHIKISAQNEITAFFK
jgi:hypothetical protein